MKTNARKMWLAALPSGEEVALVTDRDIDTEIVRVLDAGETWLVVPALGRNQVRVDRATGSIHDRRLGPTTRLMPVTDEHRRLDAARRGRQYLLDRRLSDWRSVPDATILQIVALLQGGQ